MSNSAFSVLCIEDNDDNMLVVQRILESQAFHLIEAKNGEEGLALAHQHRPNLILMDMNLPGMDGLSVTRLMKQDAILRDIPIIAVTASSVYTKKMCLEAGCEEFVLKPITLGKLLIVLHKYPVHSAH